MKRTVAVRDLSSMPHDAKFWHPEIGEVSLAELRSAAEEIPGPLSEREATFRMYREIVTRNLCRSPVAAVAL